MNIDSIAKSDDGFPKPESNQILVMDGFGYHPESLKLLLPASLLGCVLKPVRMAQFYGLFGSQVIAKGIVYQLPDTLQIAYGSNPHYQIVSRRSEPSKALFSVLYGRDYDQIKCEGFGILEAAGITQRDIPTAKVNPDNKEMLEDFWGMCRSKFKQSGVFN